MPIRKTIIAGTIATVLGGIILRLTNRLDDVAGWLVDAATIPITLPALVVFLLVAGLAALSWPHARRQIRRWRSSSTAEVSLSDLNDLEHSILELYAHIGREHLGVEFLKGAFDNTHPFRVERGLEHLVEVDLLKEPRAGSETYWLTSTGKKLCLEIDGQFQARQLKENRE